MEARIVSFIQEHWPAVAEIYRLGLLTRNATFETEVPKFQTWHKKFHPNFLWVAMLDDDVVAWAGLMPVSMRKVYEGVLEVTVYVHPNHSGKGIGRQLMGHLIEESEKGGIWTLYASIFPENSASIYLHEVHGFRKIGYREKIGCLDGIWRDTVLYEKRSKKTGL